MASSKLLKEAIADAKAVRETAIANAKIALEEAFAPKIQSLISEKISDEMGYINEGKYVSSGIGKGQNTKPSKTASSANTDLSGIKRQSSKVGGELDDYDFIKESDGDDEDLELEALIRELEGDSDEDEDLDEAAHEDEDLDEDFMFEADEDEEDLDEDFMFEADDEGEFAEGYDADEDEDEITEEELDEIIREIMEGEDEDDEELEEGHDEEHEEDDDELSEVELDEIIREIMGEDEDEECEDCGKTKTPKMEKKAYQNEIKSLKGQLSEATSVINSLKSTINEVNLLNAKLLYANKLFRNYNLTNEQKVKVIDNIDRSQNVREAKLIYSTLSESFKISGTEKRLSESKKSLVEGMSSKAVGSTAPSKKIITESNDMTRRFQELAGIITK